jgi:hypothetical protein
MEQDMERKTFQQHFAVIFDVRLSCKFDGAIRLHVLKSVIKNWNLKLNFRCLQTITNKLIFGLSSVFHTIRRQVEATENSSFKPQQLQNRVQSG